MRLRGCQLNSSSASIVCNIANLQNQKFCSWPASSPLIFSLYSIINGIRVITLEVIINRCCVNILLRLIL